MANTARNLALDLSSLVLGLAYAFFAFMATTGLVGEIFSYLIAAITFFVVGTVSESLLTELTADIEQAGYSASKFALLATALLVFVLLACYAGLRFGNPGAVWKAIFYLSPGICFVAWPYVALTYVIRRPGGAKRARRNVNPNSVFYQQGVRGTFVAPKQRRRVTWQMFMRFPRVKRVQAPATLSPAMEELIEKGIMDDPR